MIWLKTIPQNVVSRKKKLKENLWKGTDEENKKGLFLLLDSRFLLYIYSDESSGTVQQFSLKKCVFKFNCGPQSTTMLMYVRNRPSLQKQVSAPVSSESFLEEGRRKERTSSVLSSLPPESEESGERIRGILLSLSLFSTRTAVSLLLRDWQKWTKDYIRFQFTYQFWRKEGKGLLNTE